jgi:hypothetical protein
VNWFTAFTLTLLVELPVYVLLLRRWCRPARAAALGLVANLVTHPALWFTLKMLAADRWQWAALFVGAELLVWLLEWCVLLVGLRGRRATAGELAAVAGVANLSSALLGLVIGLR